MRVEMKSISVALILTAVVAGPAVGQANLTEAHGGLHWSVAAPQGAAWPLECRFRSVVVRGRHLNSLTLMGEGAQRGRLPGQDGRCSLTKTGGAGPVGVALVRDGQATAAGTNDPATPAGINVF